MLSALSILTGKMPISMIQHRRCHLVLILMLHMMDLNIRRMWVHPINNLRFEKGEFFMLYLDLRKYEDKFFAWYRMSIRKFDQLLGIVQNSLRKQCTKFREPISSEEQLVFTIT